MDLSEKMRPKKVKDFFGQEAAMMMIDRWMQSEFPGAMLFQGPSGTGKTSAAAMAADHLNAQAPHDLLELNAADDRGIATIRSIDDNMRTYPMHKDGAKVYVIDECHRLTADAQSALMKVLEKHPTFVHFILCTTDPKKVLKTVRDRCAKVEFKAVGADPIKDLLQLGLKRLVTKCTLDVQKAIIEACQGSARLALKLLEGACLLEPKDRLAYVSKEAEPGQIIDLCRALMADSPSWGLIKTLLGSIEAEPESVRRAVMGYCNACLMSDANVKAAKVMHAFSDPFFDAGTAKAMLTLACFDAIFRK